ncbi:Kef-type K+ transport system, membrane component KefB [Streptoalloteichus tenebrarius]|uniref:Kef-type K+ transport system, membrane component KefB n=1 Tax=Streptoalloteichus tenebrarius (strain ATCC 17920 / DSM 40477 / JCM 4838 / CBS 697.72 / NBRC 16177 / NCIMB 11028 / NRRL B-12390 / A12253. 1 / ISP 5477) TaxID=1933 RepID=A0ABT1HSR0_STRSD|nr:cation:proton antiporter [Streptoalloteichus tenebrarius]MCP2258518.1 Kef-type K+ transport system, membrane component KefB [Streptoalloteichus tenebrarius]BFF04119.1 cation:proton antiporter [Streptoalloteichus tenebrarius]
MDNGRVETVGGGTGLRRRRTTVRVVAGVLGVGTLLAVVVTALASTAGISESTVDTSGVDPVTRLLLAVTVILVTCHLLGALCARFGQPPVVGEILGGLALGPSGLGLVLPGAREWLLPPAVAHAVGLAAQLGLVTFMFLVGCELRVDQVRARRRAVGSVVLGATGLPFLAGVALAVAAAPTLGATRGPASAVFLGLAMSITALPVLARILTDMGLAATPVGTLAVGCAAVGDALAWGAITVLLATTTGGRHWTWTVGLTLAFVAVVFGCVRPALDALVRRAGTHPPTRHLLLPLLAAGALAAATATQLIGLHPVIGAFLFGAAVPRHSSVVDRVDQLLRGFAVTVLLPLFFAGVGLTASFAAFGDSPAHWLVFVVALVLASGTKFLGASGAARLAGVPRGEAVCLGSLLNCRGVTELVVASIGWQHGLVDAFGFTVLVLVALVTTAATGPVTRLVMARTPGPWTRPLPSPARPPA